MRNGEYGEGLIKNFEYWVGNVNKAKTIKKDCRKYAGMVTITKNLLSILILVEIQKNDRRKSLRYI